MIVFSARCVGWVVLQIRVSREFIEEVCPVNQDLKPRKYDPRSGFYPEHHSSHRNLDGLEKTPGLLDLLSSDHPDIIRRNAAIALGNTGNVLHLMETLNSLKIQIENTDEELRDYFSWAMEKLSKSKWIL